MKTIIDFINEGRTTDFYKGLKEIKTFSELVDYLGLDENTALDDIFIINSDKGENISIEEYNRLLKPNSVRIKVKKLTKDPNYDYYVTIDGKYEMYLIDEEY